MLVSRRNGRLFLVTQPEHARLAGELGRWWGNARFEPPAHRDALVTAAGHHDDGWEELDGIPAYNAEHERPAHFLELPLERTVGPYGRGVDRVYERDAHAGALVSMHWAGLYSTRWGLDGGRPVSHPLAIEVVAEQERRWAVALSEAWGRRGRRSEFEHQTWYAYEVLQALDVISLGLCLIDLDRPSGDGEPIPLLGTLGRLEQPAGARTVSPVPMAPGRGYLELTMRVRSPAAVTIDPYPFAGPVRDVALTVRSLEDRRYGTAEEVTRAYRDTPAHTVSLRLDAP
jgi:hypothetical protein